jgi:hypothetical protein
VVQRGTLNLVDLAGSERLKKSMAEGATARETAKINQSLSVLGDVLSALSSENYSGRVPYRNSKLTRLLSSTLGGNSQTFFIIHLHTTALHYHESLMSCMYGARAKRIKNMVEANNDTSSSGDMRRLQAEIDKLKASLHTNNVELMRLRETKTHSDKQSADVHEKLALMVEITSQEKQRLESQDGGDHSHGQRHQGRGQVRAPGARGRVRRPARHAEPPQAAARQDRGRARPVPRLARRRSRPTSPSCTTSATTRARRSPRAGARRQARAAAAQRQGGSGGQTQGDGKKSAIERQVAQFMATYKEDASSDEEQLPVEPPSPPQKQPAQRGTKRKPASSSGRSSSPSLKRQVVERDAEDAATTMTTPTTTVGGASEEAPKRATTKKTFQQATKRARASEVAPPRRHESPMSPRRSLWTRRTPARQCAPKHNGAPLVAVNKAPRLAPTKLGAIKLCSADRQARQQDAGRVAQQQRTCNASQGEAADANQVDDEGADASQARQGTDTASSPSADSGQAGQSTDASQSSCR